MSNVNNQYKELINEAIHNHFHDKTELEMILKDWLYGVCEQLDEYEVKAKAFDDIEERFDSYKTGVKEDYEKDMTGTNLHLLLIGAAVKNHFDNFYVKSGEADEE